MKLIWISVLATTLAIGKFTAYTKETIMKDYSKIFTAKAATEGGQQSVTLNIKKLPESHFLSGMVNNNPRMVDYLLDNYTSVDTAALKEKAADPKALDAYFIEELKKDSAFNKPFMAMSGNYLTSKGHEIKGETFTKEPVPMDSLVAIAAKFFHAEDVRPDGNIGWKIGSGITNVAQLQGGKHPVAEAFCYAAIIMNYNTNLPLKNDFTTGAGQVQGEKGVVAGQPIADTTLVAVREGVNDFMAKSQALRQVLTKAYEEKKDVLNFELQQ